MNFHQLKLPKEISKKKKLDLYKCWILDPLQTNLEERLKEPLELNSGRDRFGLTEKAAINVALDQSPLKIILTKAMTDSLSANSENVFTILDDIKSKLYVVLKVTLTSGEMDNDIVIAPENSESFDTDPHYDPIIGALNVTIQDRFSDCEIKNYSIEEISIEIDYNTGVLIVKDLSLIEKILNTGK